MNKQNLLRYATGNFLDHLGAWSNTDRLQPSPATTIIRFTLNETRKKPTIIPKGFRVSPNNSLIFATDIAMTISANEFFVDIPATCLTEGRVGNDLLPGQIDTAFDRITELNQTIEISVENISTSTGGSDIESDEAYRVRIRLAPERFSTAGSELAYIYHTLSAHSNIADASILSPEPVTVEIYVMLHGGQIPDPNGAEINAVKDTFGVTDDPANTMSNTMSGKKLRPLTDLVKVYPINAVDIDYTLRWFVTTEQATDLEQIQRNIALAVIEYETWQRERAGRDIIPDKLIKLCQSAGAKRIVLTGLNFTQISKRQVANFIENPDRIIFGGVEL
jgi:phage-related baseplate assembly protein